MRSFSMGSRLEKGTAKVCDRQGLVLSHDGQLAMLNVTSKTGVARDKAPVTGKETTVWLQQCSITCITTPTRLSRFA
jgi:hypothetical protein